MQSVSSISDLCGFSVIHFWASWAPPCSQIDTVLTKLAIEDCKNLKFYKVDADAASELVEKFEVTSVPTVVFYSKEKGVIDRIAGANVPELVQKVQKYNSTCAGASACGPTAASSSSSSIPAATKDQGEENAKEALNARLASLIKQQKVMLFMKGTPDGPQCGFSRTAVQLLKDNGLESFGFFNILADPEVRQGLKEYSNWPTYPQLYVDGSLVGGLDIMKELAAEGELKSTLGL